MVFLFIKEPKEYEKTSEEQPNMFKSLGELFADQDKSGMRILFAIFFWFLAYTGIETFLTLYATKRLGLPEGDAGRLFGHLGLMFVLFALVAGIVGSRIGRRVTISLGIILMAALILGMLVLPVEFLAGIITKAPVLGTIRGISLLLDASRDRLVLHQHQFPANGGGSDHRSADWHLYRACIISFPPCRPSLDPT